MRTARQQVQNGNVPLWRRCLAKILPYWFAERDLFVVDEGRPGLKRALPSWQILMIAIGGVIGITIFSTQGELLRLCGPGGLILSILFVSAVTICVMECLGELVVLWPVSNAMIEYVRAFLDEDLAIVVGIAYWYAMSSVVWTLTIIAADFASYTITHDTGRYILFYGIIPPLTLFFNLLGVEWFGLIEGLGGIVKCILVFVGICWMISKASHVGSINLDAGFKHEVTVAKTDFQAFCIAIPLVSYGFLGTEIVSVTAFEANDRRDLRFPARWVSYIISVTYLVSSILQGTLVSYKDSNLQDIGPLSADVSAVNSHAKRSSQPSFYAAIVIAGQLYGSVSLGWFFNGCIIYFCISAANTALYVASRTLYGLTRHLAREKTLRFPDPRWFLKPLGETTQEAKVPAFALAASFLSFFWLVPLHVKAGFAISDLLAIMSTTASIGGILVWASQCWVYIRYYLWFARLRDATTATEEYLPPEYNRWKRQPQLYEKHKYPMPIAKLADPKLAPAIFGLTGCLLIVFVFSTAAWWHHDEPIPFKRVAGAFAGPVILPLLYIIIKWFRGRLFSRWLVELPADRRAFGVFHDIIKQNLERNSYLEENGNERRASSHSNGQADQVEMNATQDNNEQQ